MEPMVVGGQNRLVSNGKLGLIEAGGSGGGGIESAELPMSGSALLFISRRVSLRGWS